MGEAYVAIFWPAPCFKRDNICQVCVLNRKDLNFCVRSTLLRLWKVGIKQVVTWRPMAFCQGLLLMSVLRAGNRLINHSGRRIAWKGEYVWICEYVRQGKMMFCYLKLEQECPPSISSKVFSDESSTTTITILYYTIIYILNAVNPSMICYAQWWTLNHDLLCSVVNSKSWFVMLSGELQIIFCV